MADYPDELPEDPKDFPVPPCTGPLRWGAPERHLLARLIDLHAIDATHHHALDIRRADDHVYLSPHYQRWPLFS